MQKTSAKRPALGIGLRILSGALFATMAIFVKALSGHVPVGQIVFFRSAFALISLVIFLELLGVSPWIGDQTTARPYAAIRVLCGCILRFDRTPAARLAADAGWRRNGGHGREERKGALTKVASARTPLNNIGTQRWNDHLYCGVTGQKFASTR
jgi:hypothetical protein